MRAILIVSALFSTFLMAVESLDRQAVIEAQRQYFMSSPERLGELIIYDHFTRQVNPGALNYMSPGTTQVESSNLVRQTALHRLNKALSEYREKVPTLSNYKNANPGANTLKYVDKALDIIGTLGGPKGAVGAAAGKMATQLTRDVLREAIGPRHQKELQNKIAPALSTRYVDEALGRIHDSKDDPTKHFALSRTIGLDARAIPGETAKEVYGRHALLYLKKAQETTDLKLKEIYELNSNIYKTLADNLGPNGQLHMEIEDLKGYFQQLNEQQVENIKNVFLDLEAAKREDEYKQEISRLETQAWREGANTLCFLIGLKSPEAGRFLSNYVKGVTQIADAAQAFRALEGAGKLGAAGLTLVSGLVGGLSTIFSLLGPSELALVMEQLKEIKQSIADLSKYIEFRFNVVDRRLLEIHKAVVENFFELRAHVNELENKLSLVHLSLENLEVSAARRAREIEELFAEVQEEKVQFQIERCNEWSLNRTIKMSITEYTFCLDFFAHCATQSAGSKIFTGVMPKIKTGEELIQFLNEKRIDADSAEKYIGVIASYTENALQNATLVRPAVDRDSIPSRFPLNPSRWQMCSEKFALMALEFPEQYSTETGRQLDKIMNSGRAIQASFRGLLRDEKDAVRTDTFDKLLSNYQTALEQLVADIGEQQKADLMRNDPQSKVTIGDEQVSLGTNSYNPWKRAKQGIPNAKEYSEYHPYQAPDEITMCPEVQIQYSNSNEKPRLSFPASLMKQIPRPYIDAAEMGIGSLSFCWEQPRWTRTREGDKFWSYSPKDYNLPGTAAFLTKFVGNLYVAIRVEFVSEGHKTGIWLDTTSNTDTAYGFHGYSQHEEGNPDRGPRRTVQDWKSGNINWFFEGGQRGAVIEVELAKQWTGMKDNLQPYPVAKAQKNIEELKNHPLAHSRSPYFQEIYRKFVVSETELNNRRIMYTQEFAAVHATLQKKINERFLSGQASFVRLHLAQAISINLVKQARLVDTYRGLLEAHLSLAFPESIIIDDELHSVLYGKDRAPDSFDLANLLRSSELSLADSQDPAEYLDQISKSTLERLKTRVSFLASRKDVENYPRVSHTMKILNRLKSIGTAP